MKKPPMLLEDCQLKGRALHLEAGQRWIVEGEPNIYQVVSGQVTWAMVQVSAQQCVSKFIEISVLVAGDFFWPPCGLLTDDYALVLIAHEATTLSTYGREQWNRLPEEATCAAPIGEQIDLQLNQWMQAWIEQAAGADAVVTASDPAGVFEAGVPYRAENTLLWLHALDLSMLKVGDGSGVLLKEARYFPLSQAYAVCAQETTSFKKATTLQLLSQRHLFDALFDWADYFYPQVLEVSRQRRQAVIDAKTTDHVLTMNRSLMQAASILEDVDHLMWQEADATPMHHALSRLLHHIKVHVPSEALSQYVFDSKDARQLTAQLHQLGDDFGFRVRQVVLDEGFDRFNCGPLLTWMADQPVVVVPRYKGGYALLDAATGKETPFTQSQGVQLANFGYRIYPPLPSKKLSIKVLFLQLWPQVHRDGWLLLILSMVSGLLGLAMPWVTGKVFNQAIPYADLTQLYQMTIGLFVVAFSIALFQLVRSFAMLRLEGVCDGVVNAGIWDRLLRLPLQIIKKYTVGDLVARANAVNAIRKIVSGGLLQATTSFFFATTSFAMLFYYSVSLAWLALAILLVLLVVVAVVSVITLRYQKKIIAITSVYQSQLLELLSGMVKLRASHAESAAFSRWMDVFLKLEKTQNKASYVSAFMGSFSGAYNLAATLAIYAVVVYVLKPGALPAGDFLAFTAAFSSFVQGFLSLSMTCLSVMQIKVLYARAKPLLEAELEVADASQKKWQARGSITLDNVSFTYDQEKSPVLRHLNLDIPQGQFVACVGPSGCGKSTLLKLFLGFEVPGEGGVYYDGRPLESLNVPFLRKQFGVVLQAGHLLPGDIYSNIVGASGYTMDDAWWAASAAGLAQEIQDMPMGMYTYIGSGHVLSGGQKQRLMIARALIHRPKILFFDEATSALDNISQGIVMKSLSDMQVTRFVIAHRLSTIRDADKIIVLNKGELVEQGTYEALMKQCGFFSHFATRQKVSL